MPVFIGDVLEASGGPVLDLSTRQVKGLGFFSNTDQRDSLSENIRVNGYISSIDSSLSVYRDHSYANFDTPWNSSTWLPVIVNRGEALNVDPGNSGVLNSTVSGFTVGNPVNAQGGNSILKAGDIFQIKNPHYTEISAFSGFESARRNSDGYPWKNQSFLVVNDTTLPLNSDGFVNQINVTLAAIDDRINSGDIIPLFENRTMVAAHRTAEDVFGEGNVASSILSYNDNQGASMLLGSLVEGKYTDYTVSIQEFISILGVGIAENYVEEGYGDYVSYGGTPGQTWSAGDINGDGQVTVADLLILLGSFGNVVEPSFATTIANILGSRGDSSSQVELNEDQYVTDDSETTMTYMFKDWGNTGGSTGEYGPQPTFVAGGAAVTYIDATNSFTELLNASSPPGDIIKFSDDENVDFYLNYFAGSGNQATQIQLSEPNINNNLFPNGSQIGEGSGYRNRITLTAEQINAISSFHIIAIITRYSSNENIGSSSQDLIDSNELVLSTQSLTEWPLNGDSGAVLFFNLINPSSAFQGVSTLNITDAFAQQVGPPMFQNFSIDGEPTQVKAVGIQMGYRFTGSFEGINMTHPDAKFGHFSLKCIPQV